jgi:hypothetical protein
VALALAGLWLALLLVLLRWQRRREEQAWPTWLALTVERNEQYLYLCQAVERRLLDVNAACDLARVREESSRTDEARLLLRGAIELVDVLVPDLRGRLQAWSRVARALTRVSPTHCVPLVTVRVARFKALAAAWAALDALLVTTRERFVLRAWVLRGGLRLLAASFHGLLAGASTTGARWRRVEDLQADLSTFSHASLDTYSALLHSLELRALTLK